MHPASGGTTQVDVTVVRTPRTLRGRLIALGIPMVGSRVLRADLENLLTRVGDSAGA